MSKETMIEAALNDANDAQLDAVWAILKYREIGIFRKVAAMSEVLGLNFEEVQKELPKDEKGRVLDYDTRHLIHDTLVEVSNYED
jgi:hypothetical protein